MKAIKKSYNFILLRKALIILLVSGLPACILAHPHFGLSEEDYEYVKKETIGGELDFEKMLDKSKTYPHNGIEYSYREMGLLMWGKAVRKLGVKSRLDAVKLYEDVTGIELNNNESTAIKAGYDS